MSKSAYIKMSTNKPMFGLVVLEIPVVFFISYFLSINTCSKESNKR